MNFKPTPIAGLWQVETRPIGDARGSLTRLFCEQVFETIRPGLRFVQSNHTRTAQRGTMRGMHLQRAPALEAKLIRCIQGSVHDVVVDLRRGSPTFGHWHAVELNDHNERQLFIPEGCAHGFQTLTDDVQMFYQHTATYTPTCEIGVPHDDPRLAIRWPLPVTQRSERDCNHPPLTADFTGIAA